MKGGKVVCAYGVEWKSERESENVISIHAQMSGMSACEITVKERKKDDDDCLK